MDKSYGLNNYSVIKIKKHKFKCKYKHHKNKKQNPNKVIRYHNNSFSNKCTNTNSPEYFNVCQYRQSQNFPKGKYGIKNSLMFWDSAPSKIKVYKPICDGTTSLYDDEEVYHIYNDLNYYDNYYDKKYEFNKQYTWR